MFDRRLVQFFEWRLTGIVVIMGITGLLTLYSAVSAGGESGQQILFYKQIVWYIAGGLVMIVTFMPDYKLLEHYAYWIYSACVSLLVFVLAAGRYVAGSRRWLDLGPFSIQPSELAKIAVIIVLARYYSKMAHSDGFRLRELVVPLLLTAVPFGLIVKQPDLGTAMIVFIIAACMTMFAKIEKKTFIGLAVVSTVMTCFAWFFLLKPYQKQRVLTFINPDRDPLGAGYHIIQSKIAIGSGMIYGKGYLKGTQNALSFLPEQHTDFIFSVMAEEWGLIGALFIILLFFMMVFRGLNIAYECRSAFGVFLCFGVTSMIFWQAVINVGMVMGLLPVVGVPLPFVSYGGSSVITVMICAGILINVSMRRFMVD